jgi:hypothetical protein
VKYEINNNQIKILVPCTVDAENFTQRLIEHYPLKAEYKSKDYPLRDLGRKQNMLTISLSGNKKEINTFQNHWLDLYEDFLDANGF